MNEEPSPETMKKLEAMTDEAEQLSEELAEDVPTRSPEPWDPPTPLRSYFAVSTDKTQLTSKQQKSRAKAKKARKSRSKNRKRK